MSAVSPAPSSPVRQPPSPGGGGPAANGADFARTLAAARQGRTDVPGPGTPPAPAPSEPPPRPDGTPTAPASGRHAATPGPGARGSAERPNAADGATDAAAGRAVDAAASDDAKEPGDAADTANAANAANAADTATSATSATGTPADANDARAVLDTLPWAAWPRTAPPPADAAPEGAAESGVTETSDAASGLATTGDRRAAGAIDLASAAATEDPAVADPGLGAFAGAGDRPSTDGDPATDAGRGDPGGRDARGAGAAAAAFGPLIAAAAEGAPAAAPPLSGAAAAASAPAAGDAGARQIAAPLHSPGFAPALGAQLTLMVRDGATEARLHLNPAEMGPISVQIRIVGQQARVEMTAEQAATRQVLEQAMPALAGALRDSGLTLTGGGVFDQPRQTRHPGGSGADGRSSGRGAGDGGAGGEPLPGDVARPPARPRGVLDLYA